MNDRTLLVRLFFWAQLALISLMAVFGSFYLLAILVGLADISSITQLIASTLALITRVWIYLLIGSRIVFGIWRRATRSNVPLDPSLRDKLQRVVLATQNQMMVTDPLRALILPRSANAFYLAKNRIVVGESLIREMDDRELAGIVGHELAHKMKHHVFFKTVVNPALLVVIIAIALLDRAPVGGGILIWTLAGLVSLIFMPISWRLEYSADAKAAELLGGDLVSRSLEKLRTNHYDRYSFTHPSLSSRIAEQPSSAQSTFLRRCPQLFHSPILLQ